MNLVRIFVAIVVCAAGCVASLVPFLGPIVISVAGLVFLDPQHHRVGRTLDVVLVGYAPFLLGAALTTKLFWGLSVTGSVAFALVLTIVFWGAYFRLRRQNDGKRQLVMP